MKKWIMPIGVTIVVCILAMNMAMPISLADENRIEIGGKLLYDQDSSCPMSIDEYQIGQLQRGDQIKVVLSEMRGSGNVSVLLTNTSIRIPETCLNLLLFLSATTVNSLTICLPCYGLYTIYSTFCSKLTLPAINEATIVHEGEEKMFTVPEDGVYYISMEAKKGEVVYKGYIEIIKGSIEA